MARRTTPWLLAVLVLAAPARAHIVSLNIGDFYLGVLHPWTALEHVLPMVALGALAARQGWRWAAATVCVFLPALAAGLYAGTVHNPESMALPNNLIYASLLVFGGLLAAAWRPPLLLWLPGMVFFGVAHGYGNGAMLRGDMQAQRFCAGAFLAMIVLLAAGTLPGALVHRRAHVIALRVVGSWVFAIGLMMIALQFAPAR